VAFLFQIQPLAALFSLSYIGLRRVALFVNRVQFKPQKRTVFNVCYVFCGKIRKGTSREEKKLCKEKRKGTKEGKEKLPVCCCCGLAEYSDRQKKLIAQQCRKGRTKLGTLTREPAQTAENTQRQSRSGTT
jgi:hypothetical protein